MPESTQQPMNPVIQGLLIGFFGSALYFAVDKYESNRTVVFTLKFLVAISSAAVLLHQTGWPRVFLTRLSRTEALGMPTLPIKLPGNMR